MEEVSQRLNKTLALEMGISRREADEHIAVGTVTIDGVTATLGARISPTTVISVKGDILSRTKNFRYLLFNKPVGYVCSRKAQSDTPTIYELLPGVDKELKPVGRLDKDSSGILLLTNDGDFAFSMTHPKFHKTKSYKVSLDADLAPLHQQMLSDHGIQLADGNSQLMLERVSDTSRKDWLVTMHEGRNRQIRRTFAALGYTVISLHRTQFGNYQDTGLSIGEVKEIEVIT